jgi:hypothetical protein
MTGSSMESPIGIVVPPGFVRISLAHEPGRVLEALVRQAAERAPEDRRSMVATFVRKQLRDAVTSARAQKASDLILSTELVEGLPVPGSLVISRVQMPASEPRGARELLISWIAKGGRPIDLDGVAGVRRVRDVAATEERPGYRQVAYLAHLDWEEQWLLISCSILRIDDAEYAQTLAALETLFDAIVQTVSIERTEASA